MDLPNSGPTASPADVFGGGEQTGGGQGAPNDSGQSRQPDNGGWEQGQGGNHQREQGGQPIQPATPPPQQITPEMIAAAVTAGVRGVQPPAPAKVLTPEEKQQQQTEFDKQFNIVRVTPEMFKSITGYAAQSPEQLKALETTLHAAGKQSIAISNYLFEQRMAQMEKQFSDRFAPIAAERQQAQVRQLEDSFLKANPDLADNQALVKELALATQMQVQQGVLKFSSRDEAFKFVADKARSLLGKAAPSGTTPGSRQSAPTQRRFGMTPTGMGGSPGSGSPQRPGNSGTVSPRDVFGDLG